MSPLFGEKGGVLFKGGHYLRKYGISYNSFIHIYFPIVDVFENVSKLQINSEIKQPLYAIYVKQKKLVLRYLVKVINEFPVILNVLIPFW